MHRLFQAAAEETQGGGRGDGARDTASRHLFYDEDALMYEFWFPPQAFDGRDLILVARSRLSADRLSRANATSEPSSIAITFSRGTTPSVSTTSRFFPSSRMCTAAPG